MTLLAATSPLMPIAHDWTAPVERVTRFPSAVIRTRSGREQRLGLSHLATETLTYRLVAVNARDAAVLMPFAQLATDAIVRVARWEDQTRVDAPGVSAGALTIPCDPSGRPTFVAGRQVLLYRTPRLWEVGEIDAVGGASIDVIDPLASDWAAGTIVAPISEGRLVLPLDLTHWVPVTSGALTFAVECSLGDIAGVGTGGAAATGVPAAVAVSNVVVPKNGRAAIYATVTDAAGNELPGDGLAWSSADAANAPVVATSDPRIALVSNPNGLDATSRLITATLGALSGSGTAFLEA